MFYIEKYHLRSVFLFLPTNRKITRNQNIQDLSYRYSRSKGLEKLAQANGAAGKRTQKSIIQ